MLYLLKRYRREEKNERKKRDGKAEILEGRLLIVSVMYPMSYKQVHVRHIESVSCEIRFYLGIASDYTS